MGEAQHMHKEERGIDLREGREWEEQRDRFIEGILERSFRVLSGQEKNSK